MKLSLQELSVVLLAANHNPSILNPDFLKYNEIVPASFQLDQPPLCSQAVAQVVYREGVSIVSQPNKMIFAESLLERSLPETHVADIAARYVEAVPLVRYLAVGINPRGFVLLQSKHDADSFVRDRLIADGPWKQYEDSVPVATVRFRYEFSDRLIMLEVNSAEVQTAGAAAQYAVTFYANFHRDVTSGPTDRQAADEAAHLLRSWERDVQEFLALIEGNFTAP